MENLISFCRTGYDGKIMKAKGYGRYGEVPVKDLEVKPMDKSDIDNLLRRMDFTFYCLNEVTYLYFFYKLSERLQAVRYSNYFGMTEITGDIAVEETLKADDHGGICVFVPGLFAPIR